MNLLTPHGREYDYLHDYANQFENSRSVIKAKVVARKILNPKIGIPPDFKTGSLVDFRWMAHSIEQGVGILRSLDSKRYGTVPKVIGEIK